MTDTYFTILQPTQGIYKEKGSRFLAFAFSVSNEHEIKQHLEALRKLYYDARHHCYAWILGLEKQSWRANDDGEPNHSAGDPILGQIKAHGLTNTLVVVVRYFGGTKLGVGGLVQAYKLAAADALKHTQKKPLFETVSGSLKFDYPQLGIVERIASEFQLEIVERTMEASCHWKFRLLKSSRQVFQHAFTEHPGIRMELE
jgi:uncharacterized YigZ family protein